MNGKGAAGGRSFLLELYMNVSGMKNEPGIFRARNVFC